MLPARQIIGVAAKVRRAMYRGILKFQSGRRRRLDWAQAVAEGKSLVDYPDFFRGMKDVSSEEISQMNLTLDNLDVNNPLVQYTKQYMSEQPESAPARGLLVLLVAQAAAYLKPEAHTQEIIAKQRSVAKIMELLHMGCFLHQGMKPDEPESKEEKPSEIDEETQSRMKLTVLSGDFFHIVACMAMAELSYPKAVVVIMEALQEVCQAEFSAPQDKDKGIVLSSDWTVDRWRQWHLGSDAGVVGSACKAALMLADHSPEVLEQGCQLAQNAVLAWKAHADLSSFLLSSGQEENGCVSEQHTVAPFSLVSLPVLFQLQSQPETLLECASSSEGLDFQKIRNLVLKGKGVEEAKTFLEELILSTLEITSEFPTSEPRTALENLVHCLRFNSPQE